MEAYFFYMEMAVVRFYYEVQKGCFSHWCDKRSVKSFCKKVWFDSTVSHNWTFGIAGAYASLKN